MRDLLEAMNTESMKKRVDDLETCRMEQPPAEEG